MDVTKTLPPGAPGTRRLMDKYGAALLCVRYRQDRKTRRRIKTVELIVEDYAPARHARRTRHDYHPDAEVLVRIDYDEATLRERAKAAGARWMPKRKLWQLPYRIVRRLRLEERIVAGG